VLYTVETKERIELIQGCLLAAMFLGSYFLVGGDIN